MRFVTTPISGLFVVESEPVCDARGSFTRSWCRREFEAQGLASDYVQHNRSYNTCRGTLRGLHFQAVPHAEAKLITVLRGSLYDVVVDLRPEASTFRQHFAIELTATSQRSLYVPERCAHGFMTLEDDTEVLYQMSEYHVPEAARGVRWNDPVFGIKWPLPVASISDRDASYPDFASSLRHVSGQC